MAKKIFKSLLEILLTVVVVIVSLYIMFYIAVMHSNLNGFVRILLSIAFPILFVPLLFKKNRKLIFIIVICYELVTIIATGINVGYLKYDEEIKISTDVNINVDEYMPFDSNSKIVTLEKESSLKLEDNLPILDGAAAVFPVYSAFINAVYPKNVKFNKEPFYYSNTVMRIRSFS